MADDPLNINHHARKMLIEELTHVSWEMGYRKRLEKMTAEELRKEWNEKIGKPLEILGV